MTTKHTPGPWAKDTRGTIAVPHGDHETDEVCEITSLDPRADGKVIALVCGDGFDASANARLIAAAPELLELARQIVLSADECSFEHVPLDILNAARAALAKANGDA